MLRADGIEGASEPGGIVQPTPSLKGGQGEAILPDLLELVADPAHPEEVHLRILQSIEGRARLVVDSDAPVQWMTPRPQGLMTLTRRGSPREFTLKVGVAKAVKSPHLKVALIFEDDQGQAYMHVSRELDLKGPKSAPTHSLSLPEGQSADGRAVRAWTPLEAPVPQTQGGAE